ncbi:MAG: glycoside hydrolase [Candidatus Nitricoxidivorans perseverans]|uniref:Glycoside hydrolase n=1 Tax=Candidatus Nitricoxidivorans perseverans TaxID=2975601 RepID=A0AA49FJJ8_9PROT|nr:MAG: glycoside hydrolase [Candidatus Nitricoxidivorans perseverans]
MFLALAAGAVMAQEHAHAPPLAVGAALDAQGRLWLARVEDRRLVVSRSEDGGASFVSPAAVTPTPEAVTADAENRPKIAAAPDGAVHLTWTQNLGQKMTGHIRYARSLDGGRTFSPPVILNDDRQVISHRFDALAIDGRGGVAAVWLDARARDGKAPKGSPQTQVGIYAAVSRDGGASFGLNRKVADHSCQCCRTGLTWTREGPVAFWRHVFGKNIRDFAIAGLNGGPVLRVTDDEWEIDGCPHHGGNIAADGRGNLHIVWFTNGKKRQGIFYRRIAQTDFQRDSNAAVMSEPITLGDPARQAGHPDVAAHGDRVLASWREFDGKNLSAWAMLSEDAGANWSAPRKLAETAGAADYALPLVDARQALVVWNTAAEGLRVLRVNAP